MFTQVEHLWTAAIFTINIPQSNFIEITHLYGWSLVNLLHVFRTPFYKNTPRRLLLYIYNKIWISFLTVVYKYFPWKYRLIKKKLLMLTLRKKCPNTEFLLLLIFPYLDIFHTVQTLLVMTEFFLLYKFYN